MNRNAVGWFEIYVKDMGRARKFYETVFEVKLEELQAPFPDIEMYCFPMFEDGPGAAGALVKKEDLSSDGMGVLVYFSSKDCAVEAARVGDNGGRLVQEKTAIGIYGYIAIAVDTEGNMFGIHSRH
ncbi:MAG: VOC family protein [Desulfofustis sp.]|jgi:predicted enzyme related to lactoylglutathione lyase